MGDEDGEYMCPAVAVFRAGWVVIVVGEAGS